MASMIKDAIDLSAPGSKPKSLLIFLNTRSKESVFYARKTIPKPQRQDPKNPYIFKNLQTIDEAAAKNTALRWSIEVDGKCERGESLKPPTFEKVANHWLNWMQSRTTILDTHGKPIVKPSAYARHKSCVTCYLNPLLGDMPISDINEETMQNYVHDRANFYIDGPGKDKKFVEYVRNGKKLRRPLKTTPPSYSAINIERVAFNAIFKHARLVMKVRLDTPPFKIDKNGLTGSSVRPDFVIGEWKKLIATLEARAAENKLSEQTRWYRRMLFHFCNFLFLSGVRVSEAKNLNCGHIEEIKSKRPTPEYSHLTEEQQNKVISHLLETGEIWETEYRIRIPANLPGLKSRSHARLVVPMVEMNHVISALFHYYKNAGIEITADSPLFMHQDGTRIERFDHAFDRVLKKINLLHRNEQKRSLSSIRHTYATQRIHNGATRNGLSFLCANMGTSPEMIKKHYDHALVENEAPALQNINENAEKLERLLAGLDN